MVVTRPGAGTARRASGHAGFDIVRPAGCAHPVREGEGSPLEDGVPLSGHPAGGQRRGMPSLAAVSALSMQRQLDAPLRLAGVSSGMSAERIRDIRKRFKRWQMWSCSVGSEELNHLAGRSLRHQAPAAEHQDPIGG
jgi:hypothetical protein